MLIDRQANTTTFINAHHLDPGQPSDVKTVIRHSNKKQIETQIALPMVTNCTAASISFYKNISFYGTKKNYEKN